MALSPLKAIFFCFCWTFWVSAWAEAENDVQEIPECTGWDILVGCGATIDYLFQVAAIGIVPDAPDLVNVPFVILGVLARITIAWSVIELVRGS